MDAIARAEDVLHDDHVVLGVVERQTIHAQVLGQQSLAAVLHHVLQNNTSYGKYEQRLMTSTSGAFKKWVFSIARKDH